MSSLNVQCSMGISNPDPHCPISATPIDIEFGQTPTHRHPRHLRPHPTPRARSTSSEESTTTAPSTSSATPATEKNAGSTSAKPPSPSCIMAPHPREQSAWPVPRHHHPSGDRHPRIILAIHTRGHPRNVHMADSRKPWKGCDALLSQPSTPLRRSPRCLSLLRLRPARTIAWTRNPAPQRRTRWRVEKRAGTRRTSTPEAGNGPWNWKWTIALPSRPMASLLIGKLNPPRPSRHPPQHTADTPRIRPAHRRSQGRGISSRREGGSSTSSPPTPNRRRPLALDRHCPPSIVFLQLPRRRTSRRTTPFDRLFERYKAPKPRRALLPSPKTSKSRQLPGTV